MVARPVMTPSPKNSLPSNPNAPARVNDEPVELDERAVVDQRVDALARRAFAARVLPRERLGTGGFFGFRAFCRELVVSLRATLHRVSFARVGQRSSTAFAEIRLAMRVICGALALAVVGAVPSSFPQPPPLPPEKAVADTMYGTSVTDPYRYFENMDDPAVKQFFKDQNDYTRAVLDRLGAPREALFERIKSSDNAGAS